MRLERPVRHFTPPHGWMNDPNGLVWFEGEYHLFYQHNPDAAVWGPMHWGHAVSTDLEHWTHLPIALAPDASGTMFSGSIVADHANTAGFGKPGQTALVAIYTVHDPDGKQIGTGRHESQALAYSLDRGRNWTKFECNPVLPNPGDTPDFRDPKVMWHSPTRRWILSLAVGDEIRFYASPDLKQWSALSRFGRSLGAHGGIWECPDLFEVRSDDTGETRWVLFVSLNPGGVQGGSGTQYFYGDFDGVTFTPAPECLAQIAKHGALWLDFGPDHYAGVTFANLPEARPRPVMIGWMNNWQYGQAIPENGWRGAMALPRELSLKRVRDGFRLASRPVKFSTQASISEPAPTSLALDHPCADIFIQARLTAPHGNVRLTLSGVNAHPLTIDFNGAKSQYAVLRDEPALARLQGFAGTFSAPRLTDAAHVSLSVHLDHGSIELFADDGLTPITLTHFSGGPFDRATLDLSDAIIERFDLARASLHPHTEDTGDRISAVLRNT